MISGSGSKTGSRESQEMSAQPRKTIAGSWKRSSTATAPEFRGATCQKRFGDWKNTHRRFSRWAKNGVWQRLFEHLAGDANNEYAMIDSTIVRAHQHSAGAPKKR